MVRAPAQLESPLSVYLAKIWGFARLGPTKEALARKKSEGKRLGRPKGKFSSVTKLTGKDDLIREYLAKKIPQSVIARLLNVHRLTVRNYIQTRKLQQSSS